MDEKKCIIPYTGISISPRGIIRACCNQTGADMLKWENIKDLDENIPWPSKNIIVLQKKMQEHDIEKNTPECTKCWQQESHGSESYRQHYKKIFQNNIDKDIEKYIKTPKLKYLDIQFGFLCNLSCGMCAPSLSSGVQSTRLKMSTITDYESQKKYYKSGIGFFSNIDWTTDNTSYSKLKNICQDITAIKISGGEPLFNPKFKDFLNFLINKETPIEFIHLTTNGTIYDQEIVTMLQRVKKVEFRFSIESIGIEDEFIRWPTIWSEKINNLKFYMSKLSSKNFANICLQGLNLFSFDNTVNYINNMGFNVNILVNVLNKTDMISLWHCDKDYIKYYLDNTQNKNSVMYEHASQSLIYPFSEKKVHARFVSDLAKIQHKNIEDIFPIWFKFHKKYI